MSKMIGLGKNQVPTNGHLGSMAYQDSENLSLGALKNNPAYTRDIPAGRPSYIFDFANSDQVDARMYHQRASSATTINKHGMIELVGENVPRITHDPDTLECLGYLSEYETTNLIPYSSDFINHTITGLGCASNTTDTLDPSGNFFADRLAGDGNNTQHFTSYPITVSNGTSYTFSVFVKDGTFGANSQNPYFSLLFQSGIFSNVFIQVNMSDPEGDWFVHPSATGGGVDKYPNGWYRVWVSAVCTGSNTSNMYMGLGNLNTYTLNTDSYLYVYGMQFEADTYTPSSYIPTSNGNTKTRAREVGYVDLGPGFGSEGTVIMDAYFTKTANVISNSWYSTLIYQEGASGFRHGQFRSNPGGTFYYAYESSSSGSDFQKAQDISYTHGLHSEDVNEGRHTDWESTRWKSAFGWSNTGQNAIFHSGITYSEAPSNEYERRQNQRYLYIGTFSNWGGSRYNVMAPIRKVSVYPKLLTRSQLVNLVEE